MKIEHKDARILREGLNFIFKGASPSTQKYIKQVLAQYAVNVKPYCDHEDAVEMSLPDGTPVMACLDCGNREIVTQ